MTIPVELVRYDAACQALAEAKSVDEVKQIRNVADAMRAYARQAKNRQMELDAAEIRIRAERRVGQLIAAQRESVGLNKGANGSIVTGSERDPVKDSRPTLAENGIDKHLAHRSRALEKLSDEDFTAKIADWREGAAAQAAKVTVDVLAKVAHVSQNTGQPEWYTPSEYLEPARAVLGSFDLDPASSVAANAIVQAATFFTEAENGLLRDWSGRVWMNPPYAQPLIGSFCRKLAESYRAGTVSEAVALVNNATETEWFHALADASSAICFPKGRVKFWSPSRQTASPLQGQALIYLGHQAERFCDAFERLGIVVEVRR